jgi:hypothetical protein
VAKGCRVLLVFFILILSTGVFVSEPLADDLNIPAKCRPREAIDDPKCAPIIERRFVDRNLRLSKQDKLANADIKQRILATTTQTGETIQAVLDYVGKTIPFVVTAWHFVYSRSGSEYVVLEYGNKTKIKKLPDDDRPPDLFDYDLETSPVDSICNSRASGYVVWKIENNSFVPCGAYANMIALGPQAFVWAVNDGRRGFEDSGYDNTIANNFSFFSKIPTGIGKLSDYVNPNSAKGLTFYWNAVQGYVVRADNLDCPPRKVGLFTVTGQNCDAKAAAARDISGKVLPFKIYTAIRNRAFVNGMVAAQVAVGVGGGGPGDWMATAVYIAEHSVVRDVTFAEVDVLVLNPWGDKPPLQYKRLASVYYAPIPARSPWKEKWTVLGASRLASLADIEFDILSNTLMDDPDKTPDPDKRASKAEAAAKATVIRKYGLPKDWKSTAGLGLDGQYHDREQIHIENETDVDASSMSSLEECLKSDRGTPLWKGCLPNSTSWR